MSLRFCGLFLKTLNDSIILSFQKDRFKLAFIIRQFQLSSFDCKLKSNKNYIFRESKMLKKLMTGSSSRKKKFYSVPQTASKTLESLGSTATAGQAGSKKPLRRIQVLNDIFSQYITEIMSNGEVGEKLVGLGIQITGVRVANDFTVISVYWVANEKEDFTEIEKLLEKTARSLRHELSQLRVIGVVPPIQFTQDKHFFKALYVEKVLASLDYGPDYEPKELGYGLRSFTTKNAKLSNDVKSKINEFEKIAETTEEDQVKSDSFDLTSENMKNDLLGLDHFKLMSQVKERVSHIKNKIKIKEDEIPTEIQPLSNTEILIEESNANRKGEFQKFLKKRKIAWSKELKLHTMSEKEKDFYEASKYRAMTEFDEPDEIEEKDEIDDSYERDLEAAYNGFKEKF